MKSAIASALFKHETDCAPAGCPGHRLVLWHGYGHYHVTIDDGEMETIGEVGFIEAIARMLQERGQHT